MRTINLSFLIVFDPLLTIITPCYNHGRFLDDMIESVHGNHWLFPIEHIIINDGSTDSYTINKLREISERYSSVIQVVNQTNLGLGAARNVGVNLAKGKYILPLDSDNKIDFEGLSYAVSQFETESGNVAVLYGNAIKFGQVDELWDVGDFDCERILVENYIDACALIRTDQIKQVGCYATDMPYMGWEDWEMWLRFVNSGFSFKYIPNVLFQYRVSNESMISLNNLDSFSFYLTRLYLINKYPLLYQSKSDLVDSTLQTLRDLHKSVVVSRDIVYRSNSYRIGNQIVRVGSYFKKIFTGSSHD